MDGWLIIDKPVGISSYSAVKTLKKIYGAQKVGHAGTLDPFASGVLLIALDKATKILRYLEARDKTYEAVLELGTKTDTGDLTGNVIAAQEPPNLTLEEIQAKANEFVGEIKQIPPMYSALKRDGTPLYKLARQGIVVERKARFARVEYLECQEYRDKRLRFVVRCSKGTYIRTLGEDLAAKLNCVGHLSALRRSAVGEFKVDDALKLTDITRDTPLLSVGAALKNYRRVDLDAKTMRLAKDGRKIKLAVDSDKVVLFYRDKAIAIYAKENDYYRSERGLL